jgi:hypothetical protein
VDDLPLIDMANAVLVSAVRNVDGTFRFDDSSQFWQDPANLFIANPDPERGLSGFGYMKTNGFWGEVLDYADFGTVDGVSWDDFTATHGRVPDMNRTNWGVLDHNLSFDLVSKEVASLNIFAVTEIHEHMWGVLHSTNMAFGYTLPGLTQVNADEGVVRMARYVDVQGGEAVAGSMTAGENWPRRIAGKDKVVSPLATSGHTTSSNNVTAYLKNCLLHGFYPGMNSTYWAAGSATYSTRDGAYWDQYMPVIQLVGRAGWEPVSYASGSTGTLQIERHGQAGDATIYLTVKNAGGGSASPDFTVLGAPLGITAGETVVCTNLVTGVAKTVTRDGANVLFSDTIDAADVAAYQLTITP